MKNIRVVASCLAVIATLGIAAWAQLGDPVPRDARVERALDQKEVKYTIDSDGDFRVLYDMGEGRSQLAIIRSKTEKYRSFETREILSLAYESPTDDFSPAVANYLLEQNARVKIGSWSKQGKGAVYRIHISALADGDALTSGLKVALEMADEFEKKTTGDKDAF